jgi:hypothetical protein
VPKLVSANFSRISRGGPGEIRSPLSGQVAAIPTAANSFVEATGQNRQIGQACAHGARRAALHAGARDDKTVSVQQLR